MFISKKIYLILSAVALLSFSGCKPGVVDPALDLNFNRVEVTPKLEDDREDHPLVDSGVASVWSKSSGVDNEGNRVIIASIGTGLDYTISDLRNSLWQNIGEMGEKKHSNGVDDDGNGYADDLIGYDFYTGDGKPYDWHGHDTFTSSVMVSAGIDNQNTLGVAPNAALMVLRYLGPDGRGSGVDASLAIDYAVENGARVAYLDYPKGGFGAESELVLQAIERATAQDVMLVIPAGNTANQDVAEFLLDKRIQRSPAVIVVAGLTESGRLSQNTNYGRKLATIAARVDGFKAYFSGHEVSQSLTTTSVAAALTASSIALLSTYPGMGRSQEIKAYLMQNTSSRTPDRLDVLSGGALNLED